MANLSQASVYGLLLSQALALLGHLVHAPLGILAFWLLCALWRLQIARMRLDFATMPSKLFLMVLAGFLVWQSRGHMLGIEAGVVLLIGAFSLKMLEARTQRDGHIVIWLGFFVVLSSYLFESALWMAFYSVLPIALLITVWLGLYSKHLAQNPWQALKVTGSLLAWGLPVMLVLFVSFPRLEPLWSMPVAGEKNLTGLSEQMSPADIAELSQSSGLAFRATFDDQVPAREQLYWRALTLEVFDGRRWSRGPVSLRKTSPAAAEQTVSYSVLMQPTGQRWLFVLDPVLSVSHGRVLTNASVQRRQPVEQALLYQAVSSLQAPSRPAPQRVPVHLLALPETGEPRTRQWAQELQSLYPEPQVLVEALMRHFREEPFVYTLKPGVLGRDGIDEFLFTSRRGFCAHYASAMTFVLRVAGIPARVVAGYQGGEFTSATTLQVRQFDAHAWVEYWHPEQGWVSVDPTYAVAPSRIEQGLEQAVAEEQSFLASSPFSPLRFRQVGWLNQLRLSWDQLNHRWQYWVLGFDQSQQAKLWQQWLALKAYWPVLLGSVLAAGLLLWTLALFYTRPTLSAPAKSYQRFSKLMAAHGLLRQSAESPLSFSTRAQAALPDSAQAIEDYHRHFMAQTYAGAASDPVSLKRSLNALKRSL